MEKINITVASASGVEAVTARELKKFGVDAKFINGRAELIGGIDLLCKCNLMLRTADRVFVTLGSFPAETFDQLYDGILSLKLGEYIDKDGSFPITVKTVQSKLTAYSAIQSVSKKAAAENLCEFYKTDYLPESGARYKIEVSIFKDTATVNIDSSGEGLHKRGYRDLSNEAPLKETLAAAMIMLSVWNPLRPLCDPFCGSGTIPIEAAMIGMNIAPGLNRDFDFLHWKFVPYGVYEEIKNQALSEIDKQAELHIYGFDIDEKAISMSLRHARAAGVAGKIHFQKQDVKDFSSKLQRGVIVANPPYGERLSDKATVSKLYKTLGEMYRSLDDWCCSVITSFDGFEKYFGMRADKKRKLYNANLICTYYQFLSKKLRLY